MTLSTTLTRSQKPLYNLGQGARIDRSNRMSAGLVLAAPFHDYPVKTPWDVVRGIPATATASPTWGLGPVGSYMTFNGSSQNVNWPHNAAYDFGNGPFTIAAIFKRGRTSASANEHVFMNFGTNGPGLLLYPANNLSAEVQNVGSVTLSSTTITDTTTFHMGMWTRSSGGTTNKLYIDGVDRTGTINTRTLASTTSGMVSGGDAATTGTWSGSIAGAFLWNRMLSDAEALSMYREPWQVLLPVLPARRWLAAGGIVNPLTLTATQTQAGTLQKQVNLPRLAAQAQAGARQSQVNLLPKVGTQAQTPTRRSNVQLLPKLATQAQAATSLKTVQPVAKTATQAQVATATRLPIKLLLATQGQTATMVRSTLKTLQASQPQTASMIRAVLKTLMATQPQAATAAEQLVKLLTFLATQPQAATVQKLTQKTLRATQAQAGSVAKVVAKTLLAAQPGASTLIRTVAKPLSAVQAQAASLQNQVNKPLLATQAQVATESGIRPFTGTVLTLLATQTQVASVTKQVGKTLTATLGGQVGPTCRNIILVGNRLAKRITNFVYTRL